MKLFEKKEKKNTQTGPGHLKQRNHFDGKDMILLVVMLIIIYGVFTWIEFFAQENANAQQQNATSQSISESSQSEE